MCGRFLLTSPPEAVGNAFNVDVLDNFPARYNIAPTQPIAIIRKNEIGERIYALARWGFIPSWAKKIEGKPLINARGETVSEKPSFRSAFKRRRCLIPADGFYEWRKEGDKKQPFLIRPEEGGVFGFAGIWETATDPDGGEIDTTAMLTISAGEDLQRLHHREPVVIPSTHFSAWLDTDERDLQEIAPLIRSADEDFWSLEKVSTAVNSVRNDGPHLIEAQATLL